MKKILIAIIVITGFSSFITSLNPLITYRNAQRFDQAIGEWREGSNALFSVERFRGSSLEREFQLEDKKARAGDKEDGRLMDNAYVMRYTTHDVDHSMFLLFSNIGGQWFAQLSPVLARPAQKKQKDVVSKKDNAQTPVELWQPGSDHTYSFGKVEIKGDHLQFIPVNGPYVLKLLNDGMAALPYEQDRLFGTSIITASPEQLEKFFSKYGNDAKLFSKMLSLDLKKLK